MAGVRVGTLYTENRDLVQALDQLGCFHGIPGSTQHQVAQLLRDRGIEPLSPRNSLSVHNTPLELNVQRIYSSCLCVCLSSQYLEVNAAYVTICYKLSLFRKGVQKHS